MLFGLALLGGGTPNLLAQQPSTNAQPWLQRLQDPRPVILGHRSCWREASENSLRGIKTCADHGIEAGEVDIRATKDGVLVLMHDDTLDRMTTMQGAVADHTYAEIGQGYLRERNGGPNAAPTDERVPTLAEALRVARGHIVLVLDVKVPLHEKIRATVVQEHAEEWVHMPTQEKPGSPEFAKLPVWAQRHAVFSVAECRTTYNIPGCVDKLADGLKRFDDLPRPLVVGSSFRDDEFLRAGTAVAKEKGIRLGGASLDGGSGGRDEKMPGSDPLRLWAELLGLGIDVIITDRPLELDEYLRSKGQR